MLLKYYRVMAINETLKQALKDDGRETYIDIVANDMHSAWRKFCVQRFGALKPNPYDYDISLNHTKSV